MTLGPFLGPGVEADTGEVKDRGFFHTIGDKIQTD